MKGYIYILTNPALKVVKIGKTSRTPEERAAELYTTALPSPFEIFAYLQTEKFDQVEKSVHRILDLITTTRCNQGREFFDIDPNIAYKILENLALLINDAVLVSKNTTKVNKPKSKRKSTFRFSKINMHPGEKVQFAITGEEFEICDDKHILVNGKPTTLSRYTVDFMKKKTGIEAPYQGPKFFVKDGVQLRNLYN